MLEKCSRLLQRMARGWVVILFLVLFFLTTTVVFPFSSRLLGVPEEGVTAIDTRLYYTPAELYGMMDAYGEQGRVGYALNHVTADLLFPLVYSFFFGTAISFLFLRAFTHNSRIQRLNLTPFALLAVDLVENISLLVLLLAFPAPLRGLAFAAGIVTAIKWLLSGVTLLLVLFGLAAWLFKRVKSRD